VIPKSEPIPAPKLPKTKGDFFNFFRTDPAKAVQLGPPFVRQMDPGELVRLLRLISKSDLSYKSEIEEAVVKRTEEICSNFTLAELLVVARHFGLTSRRVAQFLDPLIRSQLSLTNLKPLKNSDLIFLIRTKSGVVADELIRRRHFSSYEIATIANEFKKQDQQPQGLFERLIKLFLGIDPQTIRARDLSLLANAYSDCPGNSVLMDKISHQSIDKINDFSPQGLSVLLHALVRADTVGDHSLVVKAIADRAILATTTEECEPHTIGLLMYSFGKSEIRNEKFLKHFSELVKRKIQDFDFRSLGSLCYGFSRLGFKEDKDLWRLIADELVFRWTEKRNSKMSKRANPADIAMIAKAFSKLGKTGYDIIDEKLGFVLYRFLKRSALGTQDVNASTVVEVLDAFTRLPKHGHSVETWIRKQVPPLLEKMNSTQLVTVLTGAEGLGIESNFFRTELAKNANKITNPVLRTVAAVRLAKMQIYDPVFAKTTVKLLSANLGSLDFRALVNALFAFSEMNHREEVFVNRIIQALRHQLRSLGSVEAKHLSTLAVAASRLRLIDESFYDELLAKIFENSSIFETEQTVCNTLFSLATALGSGDFKNSSGWFIPVSNALLAKLSRDITVEGIRQLQILSLALKLKNIQLDDIGSTIILEKANAVNTFAINTPSLEQSSAVHREISKLFSVLGLEHRNEATIGPFSIDIFVPQFSAVVEVDGPHHFFRDTITRTSSSVLKHMVLESMGYRVTHVPFHEWLQCSTEVKKMAYCSDIVNQIQVHSF
jgi:very-short-patch-repair endonuclease